MRVNIKSIQHSNFIEMIKSYRSSFIVQDSESNWFCITSLREAKEICEQIRDNGSIDKDYSHVEIENLCNNGFEIKIINSEEFTPLMNKIVTVYIRDDGQKIKNIRNLRYATGFGLKESKDIIDKMWRCNKPVELQRSDVDIIKKLRYYGFTVQGCVDECFKGQEDLFEI